MTTNFNLPNKPITTYPTSSSNQITKEYYNFLVGEINRGVICKAVCKVTDERFFNVVSYYLVSER